MFAYVALVPLVAGLVYREVEVLAQIVDELDGVLQADLHPVLVTLGAQRSTPGHDRDPSRRRTSLDQRKRTLVTRINDKRPSY